MRLLVPLFWIVLVAIIHDKERVSVFALSSLPSPPSSRRLWLSQTLATGGTAWLTLSSPSVATATTTTTATITSTTTTTSPDELPTFLRQYTKLAPLGPQVTSNSATKTRGLSLEELAQRLSHDLTVGATGQGGYFLTGDLSTDIFRDNAIFMDPTNRVASLSQYQQALRILFDPSSSKVELVDGPLIPNPTTRTITGRIRSRGYLQLPWHPYIPAYESTIVYTVDEEGLIVQQAQTWTKAATQALRESFTPSLVGPPLQSSRTTPPPSEPPLVTALFDMLNGRRPYEYSAEERVQMDQLVEQIIHDSTSSTSSTSSSSTSIRFDRTLLPGTWMLAYLQPGPNGAGIDRRIPFPELEINDSFQVFGKDGTTLRNVGQVLGPWANVQVYGTLQEENPSSLEVPKRFRATIQGGKLCVGGRQPLDYCIDLPIQGEGLFDSLYLGDRLRIGQNINGGGARVVQIRLDDDVSIL